MKRNPFIAIIVSAALLMSVSCDPAENQPTGPVALETPVPKAGTVTETTAEIAWEAVAGAQSYSYYIVDMPDTLSTDGTEILVEGLTPARDYTVMVRAESSDESQYLDSEWGSVSFTTSESVKPEPESYTVYALDPMVVMEYATLGTAYVRNLSPAGNYAVGFDDQLGDPTSFVWDRSTGEYTILDHGDYMGCKAYDVNDEGLIVGSVITSAYEELPAYMDYSNGGTWTLLPTNGISSAAYPSFAVAVTNDGMIGGQVITELSDGTERCVPCLWKNFQLDQSGFELPENGDDACMYGSYVYGMSDDGRVISGWQDWGIGTRSPAVWVDGKLTRIYGEEPVIDEDGTVYEGIAWAVSSDGSKVTGYFSPDGMSIVGFIYDVATGEKTEIPSYGGVAFDNFGKVFMAGVMGMGGIYWENGATFDVTELWAGLDGTFATDMTPDVGTDGIPSVIYSVSDDGLVLGGSFSYSAFGTALQYPSIIVMK